MRLVAEASRTPEEAERWLAEAYMPADIAASLMAFRLAEHQLRMRLDQNGMNPVRGPKVVVGDHPALQPTGGDPVVEHPLARPAEEPQPERKRRRHEPTRYFGGGGR